VCQKKYAFWLKLLNYRIVLKLKMISSFSKESYFYLLKNSFYGFVNVAF